MNRKNICPILVASLLLVALSAWGVYRAKYLAGPIPDLVRGVVMRFGGWKALQVRDTTTRMNEVHTALSEYYVAHDNAYPQSPVPNEPLPTAKDWDYTKSRPSYSRPPYPWPVSPSREVRRLFPILVPQFASALPTQDYWGHPLYYDISKDRQHLVIISLGSDGKPDPTLMDHFPLEQTQHDIALYDGWFLARPAGFSQ